MKNFNLNFKSIVQSKARWLLTLFAILALGVGQMWADNPEMTGFGFQFRDDSGTWFKTGTKDNCSNGIQECDFGSKTNLKIVYIYANSDKHDGNLCTDNNWLKYEIFGTTGTSNWGGDNRGSADWNNGKPVYKWGTENGSGAVNSKLDLVANRKPGDYRMEFYFNFEGNNGSGCGTWYECKYSNNNWKFTWSIPDPTISISGFSSLVAGTAASVSASISSYPVGATLTKLAVSGNVASTVSKTGTGTSISSLAFTPNASGNNGITVTVTVTYGSAGTKDYVYYYNVTPPAVSDFTITPSGSGYLSSGSGTEGSPYLVAYNSTITFGLSGATKAYADGNAGAEYSVNGGSSYGTSSTYTSKDCSTTSSNVQNYVFKARLKNTTTSSLLGSVKEKTVYYQVPTFTVTLHDNNGGSHNGTSTAWYGRNVLTPKTAPTKTGYDVSGYYTDDDTPVLIADASGNLQANTAYTDASSKWNVMSNQTLYAHWTAHTYTVTLNAGTGGSGNGTMTVDYDATAYKTWSSTVAKTGYTINGWYTASSAGTKVLNANGSFVTPTVTDYITSSKWSKAANCTLHAQWTANTYSVRFNKNDEDATGSMDNENFTYGTAKTLTANAFEKDGYSFDYWTTNADGTGTQYTNGQSVSNLTSTNGGVVDLYAHWTKVTVTDLTFAPATSAGSTSVTVTPTLSGTPTGTSSICWALYYDSECTREVPKITFSPDPSSGAGSATFTCPAASGSYYVKATYRAGSDCNGTVLNTFVKQYVVASEHTVVIKYMQGSAEIASRGNVVVPAASSAGVKAPEIFGYTFSSWSLSEGLSNTCADAGSCGTGKDSINISAVIDGILTANYNRDNIIYLKNTLNWDTAFVNLYPNAWFGSDANGAGAGNHDLDAAKRNKGMKRVPGHNDVWYYNYGNTATTAYVSFTDRNQDNYYHFSGTTSNRVKVIYPTRPDATQAEAPNYGFNSGTPMFVPIDQTGQKWNGSTGSETAEYFDKGYWRDFVPATGATGYTLEIYNKVDNSSRYVLYSIPMTDATGDDIFEATVVLEGGKTGASKYGVKILRNTGMRYTNITTTFDKNGNYMVLSKEDDSYAACGLETTVAGNYTIRVTCGNDGKLKAAVTYPAASGDYQLLYKDNVHTAWHPSDVVRKVNNSTEIVSFFVRTGSKSQSLQMQSCTVTPATGAVSWSNYGAAINPASTYSSVITKDGVYNFHLSMDNNGALSIDSVTPYTGNFYIRTDVVGGTKWADFRNASHQMTYSDYAKNNEGYSHYYMHWVTKNTNVKFTVANDYSPCISDTLAKMGSEIVANMDAGGTFSDTDSANVRFMYNDTTNEVSRAYLAGAQTSGSYFLVLSGQENNLMTTGGARLVSANNGGVGNDEIQLSDDRDWIYKTSVKAKPGGLVKLYAKYGSNYQYFIGKSGAMDASHAEALIGGDGDAQVITVVYDFKTNRMIAAWEPADTIEGATAVNADIIIVREHQGASNNIVFKANEDNLSTEKTVYGVMRFNKYILNNRSTTGTHEVLPVGQQLPLRERNHYYVSFPFDVNVSDIFGFGTYGVHWVLQYYDGVARAKNGLWADPGMTYWKYVPPTGKLKANEGYLLALSPSQMAYNKDGDGEVWSNGKWEVELYFPDATKGATIGVTNVIIPAPGSEYVSIINRGTPEGDRTIKDSYWRCIGVPSFKDYTTGLTDGSSALAWSDPAAYETGDIHFLYEVQWADNSLRAVSGDTYKFKAMHAYMVQNSTAIVWSSVSAIKSIVARRQKAGDISNYEFRLTLNQNDEVADQTFVRLTDDENVTNGFEFGHDMSKEMYSTKANIFTYIGYEPVAANSMPFTEQTTVVPVGVKVVADGDYTFAMPDGTSGVGVTLVDNVENIRTSLSALDYTVHLAAGDYTNRFTLEISPIKETPTGIENSEVSRQNSDVRKVLIDGLLYIVKDGKMYDARGNRIQ